MKSILLSIKPEWVEKILNGKKTIEVRKKFPKDYVGWVYIYCTKDSKTKLSSNSLQYYVIDNKDYKDYLGNWNGKVVARFWCDKVEEIRHFKWVFDYLLQDKIYKASCLDNKTLSTYLKGHDRFYAIHISQLEIFDRPRELRGFMEFVDRGNCKGCVSIHKEVDCKYCRFPLAKAPQNYCYIEGDK